MPIIDDKQVVETIMALGHYPGSLSKFDAIVEFTVPEVEGDAKYWGIIYVGDKTDKYNHKPNAKTIWTREGAIMSDIMDLVSEKDEVDLVELEPFEDTGLDQEAWRDEPIPEEDEVETGGIPDIPIPVEFFKPGDKINL